MTLTRTRHIRSTSGSTPRTHRRLLTIPGADRWGARADMQTALPWRSVTKRITTTCHSLTMLFLSLWTRLIRGTGTSMTCCGIGWICTGIPLRGMRWRRMRSLRTGILFRGLWTAHISGITTKEITTGVFTKATGILNTTRPLTTGITTTNFLNTRTSRKNTGTIMHFTTFRLKSGHRPRGRRKWNKSFLICSWQRTLMSTMLRFPKSVCLRLRHSLQA